MWIKEHILETIGLVVALLTYFGVGPSDLAANISILTPALYLVAGGLVGWGLCRALRGLRRRFHIKQNGDRISVDEFAENFVGAPYEIKAFLKTVLEKGAAYRRTDDVVSWKSYLEYLGNFVIGQTIRNNITKYTMREGMKQFFDERPDLLQSVSDEDIKRHAVNGEEGEFPIVISQHFYWWYYTNDLSAPKAFKMSDHLFGVGA